MSRLLLSHQFRLRENGDVVGFIFGGSELARREKMGKWCTCLFACMSMLGPTDTILPLRLTTYSRLGTNRAPRCTVVRAAPAHWSNKCPCQRSYPCPFLVGISLILKRNLKKENFGIFLKVREIVIKYGRG